MAISAVKKPLLLLAFGLPALLAGCATRESAERAQASADLADTHAGDARSRADAAQARADGAMARADEAEGIGNNAMGKATGNEQRVVQLESDLKTAHAQIKWLSRNVVYKHPIHHRHRKHQPAAAAVQPMTPQQSPPKNPGM